MPIYEYVCPSCELKFELLRPLSQAGDGASCPSCHGTAERVLSPFCALSKGESGEISSIGGNTCTSCGATSCNTCGI